MKWKSCILVLLWFRVGCSQLFEGDDCDLDNSEQGKCVRLSQCPSAIDLIPKREHPITCSFDKFTPIVCCPVAVAIQTRLSEQKCMFFQKVELKPTEPSTSYPFNVVAVNPNRVQPILIKDPDLPTKNLSSIDFDTLTQIIPMKRLDNPKEENNNFMNTTMKEEILNVPSIDLDILTKIISMKRSDSLQEENTTLMNSTTKEEIVNVPFDIRAVLQNENNTNNETNLLDKVGTLYIRLNYTEDTSKPVQDPLNITLLNITINSNISQINTQPKEILSNIEEIISTSTAETIIKKKFFNSNISEINFQPIEFNLNFTEHNYSDNSVYTTDERGIILGIWARDEEFPHMAALGFSRGEEQLWRCGGSLVSEKFVLTAAHCLSSSEYGQVAWVSLGSNMINLLPNSKPVNNQKIYKIIRRIPHPLYKRPSSYHDIALVELDRPVEFTTSIRPACLHSSHDIDLKMQLQATGWGLTQYGGDASDYLQKVDLDVYSFDECTNIYDDVRGSRRLRDGIMEEAQFCAGGRQGMQDTCSGDSGGPLQLKIDQSNGATYSIIGITSFGKSCGVYGLPGVYVRISEYLPWLENIIWSTDF